MTADHVDLTATVLSRYQLTAVRRDPRQRAMKLPRRIAEFLSGEVLTEHRHDELLGALFVDAQAMPLAYSVPYLGHLERLRIDAKHLLAPGVVLGAAALILFHHHPIDKPWFSDRDLEVAELFRDAGEVVSLRLLDYLVLGGDDAWVSLRRQGLVKLHSLAEEVPSPSLQARVRSDDKRRQVRPKYANPDCPDETWSGRGRRARWLQERIAAGAKLEDFLIEDD